MKKYEKNFKFLFFLFKKEKIKKDSYNYLQNTWELWQSRIFFDVHLNYV